MGWDEGQALEPLGSSGIWVGTVPLARAGQKYKFRITQADGRETLRADPVARAGEGYPGHASIIDEQRHVWTDGEWMSERAERHRPDRPLSIYEMHLGSWLRHSTENRPLSYVEVAETLADYLEENGFTHVEFMPLLEHPFTGSWGYQVTGFFQPTARYGTPDELRHLIDVLHRRGLGVILDWVPAHFPADEFALALLDGTHLYEHADPKEGRHPDWGSLIFNYGRHEVRAFLVSSACWWLRSFHIDGLRVDAVASMLYRDYSRGAGEWVPNKFGGNENLEAIELLQQVNAEVHRRFPDVLTVAEESTAWGGVTADTRHGGLGFDFKWDMGWMNDTLTYLERDPIHRKWHQNDLTFRQIYSQSERFILPLSHDEVVHGKGSMINKMPGDEWQQHANLRLLYGYQHVTPGKKMLFMGCEFAQRREWNHDTQLDWELLQQPLHLGMQRWVSTLNHLHQSRAALHQYDHDQRGFAWLACDDNENSVFVAMRRGEDWRDDLVAVLNFTPNSHEGYAIGMPHAGEWELVANSDAPEFGGSGFPVPARITADGPALNGLKQSAFVNLVPLGMTVYGRVVA
jgi:1,4-alpha-glucan branching enzyme